MADNQQIWSEEQDGKEPSTEALKEDPQQMQQEARKGDAGHSPEQADPEEQRQQVQSGPLQSGPVPYIPPLQMMAGQPALTPADIAALQQQHHNAVLMAHHAQQEYDSGQREKGAAHMQIAGPEAMAMHAMAAAQQHAQEQPHQLQHQHDADYERDRKEKRKVANREAARRMRQRRSEQVNSLAATNTELKTENAGLQQQLAHLANHNRELMTENATLRQEVLNLKQAMESNRAVENGVAG